MENDFVVVRKHPQMMLYVDSMQRKNATQLSFYPLERLERDSHLGRIFVATLNGSPCGYCYIGDLATETRIHQACIQYDARRRLYGAAIVAHIEACAAKSGSFATRLRCGFDLEANEFWKSMGYKCIRTERGGLRRMRTINVWRKVLLPELFSDIHIAPAVGKASQAEWLKSRQSQPQPNQQDVRTTQGVLPFAQETNHANNRRKRISLHQTGPPYRQEGQNGRDIEEAT